MVTSSPTTFCALVSTSNSQIQAIRRFNALAKIKNLPRLKFTEEPGLMVSVLPQGIAGLAFR